MQTTTRFVAMRLSHCRIAPLLAALGALGLAGCGGGGAEPDPTPIPNATPTPSPLPTPTPSPSPSPSSVAIVAVAPLSATVSVGDSRVFTSTISGDSSLGQAVTWSVQEGSGGGTISADGVYSAPPVPGTYHVIATCVADSAQSGSATIIVQAGSAAGSIQ